MDWSKWVAPVLTLIFAAGGFYSMSAIVRYRVGELEKRLERYDEEREARAKWRGEVDERLRQIEREIERDE